MVTEFSHAAKVPRPNVQEFLKPFGLKIKITVEKAA
jgi:hypothetical protein